MIWFCVIKLSTACPPSCFQIFLSSLIINQHEGTHCVYLHPYLNQIYINLPMLIVLWHHGTLYLKQLSWLVVFPTLNEWLPNLICLNSSSSPITLPQPEKMIHSLMSLVSVWCFLLYVVLVNMFCLWCTVCCQCCVYMLYLLWSLFYVLTQKNLLYFFFYYFLFYFIILLLSYFLFFFYWVLLLYLFSLSPDSNPAGSCFSNFKFWISSLFYCDIF
jgi:hypothetical protein